MENSTVVNNDQLTTDVSSEDETQAVAIEEVATEPVLPGSKTDSSLLLESLQEEREKRRILEEEKKLLEQKLVEKENSSTFSDEEIYSDEGKILKGQISNLKSELSEVKTELTKERLISTNPIFKEKWEEFEEFRSNPENKGMNMRTAAKAFLVENGLLEPTRKGLEKPTGGQRTPISSGMTADEVKTLRQTNYTKYKEMIQKGLIKIES